MRVAGKRVHVVGSSSVGEGGTGTLGKTLEPALRALGASAVSFDAKSGRGLAGDAGNRLAGTAAQRQAFAEALATAKPDVVLVVLGGNPSGSDAQLTEALHFVSTAVAATRAKLLWLGPPVYRDPTAMAVTEQYERLAPPVLGATYRSSLPYTDPTAGRTTDGVHFTAAGAYTWARGILHELDAAGGHPLRWLLVGAAAAAGAGALLLRRRGRRVSS